MYIYIYIYVYMYIYICLCVYTHTHTHDTWNNQFFIKQRMLSGLLTIGAFWAYTRYSFTCFVCVRESIIPLLPPPVRITHTTAILLRDFSAIYDPPPTFPLYAIHHTLSVLTISCKG